MKIKLSEDQLPSNRKFGYFFALVFAVGAAFLYSSEHRILLSVLVATSLLLLLIAWIQSDILLPLNKLWMRCGALFGMIVSPIVLGLIFFGLVTPVAVLTRLIGRDELRLKFAQKSSYWIVRGEPISSESFKNQF